MSLANLSETSGEVKRRKIMNKKDPTQMTTEEKIEFYEEKIEHSKLEIKALKEEIAGLEKYKQYRKAADELKVIHKSFVDAGFTDDQAFTLINTACSSFMKSPSLFSI